MPKINKQLFNDMREFVNNDDPEDLEDFLEELGDEVIDGDSDKEECLDLFTTAMDNDGNNFLHLAASRPQSLSRILEFLDETLKLEKEELIDLLTRSNNHMDTLIHLIVKNEDMRALDEVFNYMHDYDLTEEECLELLMKPNEMEDTAFHLAANNPDILLMLMNFVSTIDPDTLPKNAYDVLSTMNEDDQTVLHLAADTPVSIDLLLELAQYNSPDESLKMLRILDEDGNSVWHKATPKSLEMLCDFMLSTYKNDKSWRQGCERILSLKGEETKPTVLQLLENNCPEKLRPPELADIVSHMTTRPEKRSRFFTREASNLNPASDDKKNNPGR